MKRYFTGIVIFVMSVLGAYSQEVDMLVQEITADNAEYIAEDPVQPVTTPAYNRPFDYKKTAEWGKYKALRAVGWSAFGIGLPITLGGMIVAAIEGIGGYNISGPAVALIAAGGFVTLSSVPILISAYHYRGKAKKMSLDVGISPLRAPSFNRRADFNPGLSLALRF